MPSYTAEWRAEILGQFQGEMNLIIYQPAFTAFRFALLRNYFLLPSFNKYLLHSWVYYVVQSWLSTSDILSELSEGQTMATSIK